MINANNNYNGRNLVVAGQIQDVSRMNSDSVGRPGEPWPGSPTRRETRTR